MNQKRVILDKILNPPTSVQVWVAQVTAVDGLSCTVSLLASDLIIEDVRLVADADAESYLVVKPKVGSTVLVGMVDNQITDLYVIQVSEVQSLEYKQGNTLVSVNADTVSLKNSQTEILLKSDTATLKQAQSEVTLTGGKVAIKNAGVNLKDLFSDLITLLNSFSVITSTGPSAGLNPATTALVSQLQVKVNTLLQ